MLYVISILLGILGAWFVKHFGSELGFIDYPNERSSHHVPTPKGGGIGILVAFICVSFWLGIPLTFWFSASLVALSGFYGDRKALSPILRLIVQFTGAFVFLWGINDDEQHFIAKFILILPASVFIVGTANFYNFMDGINGIAGITGMIGFGLLSFFASISGSDRSFVTLCISLCLSCLGFLPFNFLRAKVFMGDVGSILLGFVFASMVICLSSSFLNFICLSAFLFPFYVDELTTMVVRLKEGEKLTRPHRRHLYQLLANEFGISHWKVSVGYGVVQLVIGINVLLLRNFGILVVFLLLVGYFSGFIVTTWAVRTRLRTVRR